MGFYMQELAVIEIEEKKQLFLSHLESTGIVKKALDKSGLALKTAYRHRKSDTKFCEEWDIAVDAAMDLLEGEAYRRAFEGVKEPVFRKNGQVGEVTKYSDPLIMFLLKGNRPAKYREKFDITKKVEVTIKAESLSSDMLAEIAAGGQVGELIEGEVVED